MKSAPWGSAVEVFRQAAITNVQLQGEAEAARARAESDRIEARQQADKEAAERLRAATSGLASGLKRLAGGDLAFQLDEPFSPDFEALRQDFNSSVKQLGDALGAVSSGLRSLSMMVHARFLREQPISPGAPNNRPPRWRRLLRRSIRLPRTCQIPANGPRRSALPRLRQIIVPPSSAPVVSQAEEAMRRIEASSQQISNILGRHRRDRLPDQPPGAECRRSGRPRGRRG